MLLPPFSQISKIQQAPKNLLSEANYLQNTAKKIISLPAVGYISALSFQEMVFKKKKNEKWNKSNKKKKPTDTFGDQ